MAGRARLGHRGGPGWSTSILFGALFVFSALYIGLRIETPLLHLKGPGLFIPDFAFFRQFLDYPGRPLRYVTLFLQALYWFPTVGAVVAGGLVALLGIASRALFLRIVPEDAGWVRRSGALTAALLPAALALVSFDRYDPVDLVAVDVTLLLALAWSAFARFRTVWRVAAFAGLMALVTLLRPESGVLLASLCALGEVARQRRYVTGLIYAVLGALPSALVGGYVLHLDAGTILSRAVPSFAGGSTLLPVAGLLALAGIHATLAWLRRSGAVLMTGLVLLVTGIQWNLPGSRTALLGLGIVLVPTTAWLLAGGSAIRLWRPRRLIVEMGRAVLAGGFLAAVILPFDRQDHDFLEMTTAARNRDWEATLRYARMLDLRTFWERPSAYSMVSRALYHLGRLPYELMHYPVSLFDMQPTPLPMVKLGPARLEHNEVTEMCLDLGLLNYAELVACDAFDAVELPGRTCELLVLVYIAKGNPEAARPLLGLLKKSLTHREWADRHLALIEGTTSLETDPEIREFRENMIPADSPADAPALFTVRNAGWEWEVVYQKLLEANPSNRMAFEYLMNYYLLSNRPDKLVENIPQMERLGYRDIPTLYQEAILTYCYTTGRKARGLDATLIDPSLASRYRNLVGLYLRCDRDPAATRDAIDRSDVNTYFAYCMWFLENAKNQAQPH